MLSKKGTPLERKKRQGNTKNLILWMGTLLCAWGIGYLCNFLALDSDLGWTRTVYYKKLAIARKLNVQRRIFLVGGSGTHYSVDAAQMERMLGMPVINFGLHGGLGLNAILASVQGELHQGDIVVLLPEYGILDNDGTGWLSAAFGASINKPGIGGVGLKQSVKETLRAGVVSLQSFGKSVFRLIVGARGRASDMVDEQGDAVHFLEGTATPSAVRSVVSKHAINRLKKFRKDMDRKGVALIFGLPWFLISEHSKQESLAYVKKITVTLSRIAPVVYDKGDFNLKTDVLLFSDSHYHLNKDSRKMRTSVLSHELQPLIARRAARN